MVAPTKFSLRPPSLLTTPEAQLKAELDKYLQRIYTAHQTLDSTVIKGPTTGEGSAIASGSISVIGSKLSVATGLSFVTRVLVSISNSSTATNYWVTGRVTPNDATQVDIYVWQPTAAGNTTPVAATVAVTVNWLALGTQDV